MFDFDAFCTWLARPRYKKKDLLKMIDGLQEDAIRLTCEKSQLVDEGNLALDLHRRARDKSFELMTENSRLKGELLEAIKKAADLKEQLEAAQKDRDKIAKLKDCIEELLSLDGGSVYHPPGGPAADIFARARALINPTLKD